MLRCIYQLPQPQWRVFSDDRLRLLEYMLPQHHPSEHAWMRKSRHKPYPSDPKLLRSPHILRSCKTDVLPPQSHQTTSSSTSTTMRRISPYFRDCILRRRLRSRHMLKCNRRRSSSRLASTCSHISIRIYSQGLTESSLVFEVLLSLQKLRSYHLPCRNREESIASISTPPLATSTVSSLAYERHSVVLYLLHLRAPPFAILVTFSSISFVPAWYTSASLRLVECLCSIQGREKYVECFTLVRSRAIPQAVLLDFSWIVQAFLGGVLPHQSKGLNGSVGLVRSPDGTEIGSTRKPPYHAHISSPSVAHAGRDTLSVISLASYAVGGAIEGLTWPPSS